MFAYDMKWRDDLTLASLPRERGVLQLAIYAEHLASSNTLQFRSVKTATIKQYLRAAAALLGKFGSVSRDYRKEQQSDTKFSRILQAVYNEHDRWMNVPNRREHYTLEMLDCQIEQATAPGVSWLSVSAACADWFECGTFGGFRCSEYAQSSSNSDPKRPALNLRGDTQAFILPDVTAQTRSGQRLRGAAIVSVPLPDIAEIELEFRMQKNGDHGKKKKWVATANPAARNAIRPFYNIINRFVALCGPDDHTTPLSVHKTKTGQIRLLNARDIEREMRTTATKVYHLCPKKDRAILQRWSSHSLRVGACVILHAMGATEAQLKFILRWRSSAFMAYMRNSVLICHMQNDCFARLDTMPNFL
jgi:hypothetical protein